jgi:hypothetical protein
LTPVEALEPLVDLGVDPGDEERGDRVDVGELVAVVGRLLEARDVRLHDVAVLLEAEDQRHVDGDAGRDRLGDGRPAGLRARDLDHHVGLADGLVELGGLGHGLAGVVGQAGGDLDRHAAVDAVGGVEDRSHDPAGLAHVVGGDDERGAVDVGAGGRELTDLGVVALAVGQRGLEDRRVGRDADDVAVLHEVGEVAGLEALTRQVVEPDGHPGVGQGLEAVVHAVPPVGGVWTVGSVRR